MLDLNNTSFEDIIGRMKAYEERIHEEEEEPQEDQTKLMYSNAENQTTQPNPYYNQDYNRDWRGRGRGGRGYYRGCGRGRYGAREY